MADSAVDGRIARGDVILSDSAATEDGGRPVLIEMAGGPDAANEHLNTLIATADTRHDAGQPPRNVGMMVGVNQKANQNHRQQDGRITPGDNRVPAPLRQAAANLAQRMEDHGLYGGAFPFVWGPAQTQTPTTSSPSWRHARHYRCTLGQPSS